MAAYSVATLKVAALHSDESPDPDTVTFTGSGRYISVLNRSGTDPLYVRFDGTDAVAGADNSHVVLKSVRRDFFVGSKRVVSLQGAENPQSYIVELF